MVTLLHVSVAATPLILCLALVRLCCWRRIPPRVFLALWSLVLCRLLMFFWVPVQSEQVKPLLNRVYGEVYNVTYLAVAAAPSRMVLIFAWIAAGAGLLGFLVFRHLRGRKAWREGLPLERPAVQAWLAEHTGRRAVQVVLFGNRGNIFSYGVLHPVIVLDENIPARLTDRELKQVLAHELGHIRGLHILLQYFTLIVCCLHWFNPFVWLMFFVIQKDMELAADAAVKRYLDPEEAKGYAKLLFYLSQGLTPERALEKNFLAPSLVERITRLRRPKKRNMPLMILAILIISLLFIILVSVPSVKIPIDGLHEMHPSYNENWKEYFQRINESGYVIFNEGSNK